MIFPPIAYEFFIGTSATGTFIHYFCTRIIQYHDFQWNFNKVIIA